MPQQIVRREARAAFQPDRIGEAAQQLDMGRAGKQRSRADPQEMGRAGEPAAAVRVAANAGPARTAAARPRASVKSAAAERRRVRRAGMVVGASRRAGSGARPAASNAMSLTLSPRQAGRTRSSRRSTRLGARLGELAGDPARAGSTGRLPRRFDFLGEAAISAAIARVSAGVSLRRSAQSPPWSRKARPACASARRAVSASISASATKGGRRASSASAAASAAGSG